MNEILTPLEWTGEFMCVIDSALSDDDGTSARACEAEDRLKAHDAALRSALAAAVRERDEARALAERLKQEAIFHAGEARTQRATVHEAAQIASGATGEKADWNGATPVRELRDRLDAASSERDRLRERLAEMEAQNGTLRVLVYQTVVEYRVTSKDTGELIETIGFRGDVPKATNLIGFVEAVLHQRDKAREQLFAAEARLAALSHIGTGAMRRAMPEGEGE